MKGPPGWRSYAAPAPLPQDDAGDREPDTFEERVESVHPTQHRVFAGISLVF
jgi:hypothetical protein